MLDLPLYNLVFSSIPQPLKLCLTFHSPQLCPPPIVSGANNHRENPIGDSGTRAVCQAVAGMASLHVLKLGYAPASPANVLSVAQQPSSEVLLRADVCLVFPYGVCGWSFRQA
jgi:hypothetical protein